MLQNAYLLGKLNARLLLKKISEIRSIAYSGSSGIIRRFRISVMSSMYHLDICRFRKKSLIEILRWRYCDVSNMAKKPIVPEVHFGLNSGQRQ